MSGLSATVWRWHWKLWLPALIFFLVNLGAFAVYRLVYAGEAVVSQEAVERAEQELEGLERQRESAEAFLQRVEGNQDRVAELYARGFATQGERLTEILREVRRMAGEAALDPQSISLPDEPLEEYGLIKRSFVFSVEGTYFDLRKLISALEGSEYFLTLEEVGLSEGGGRAGPRLRISLRLSTLFAAEPEDGAAAAAAEGET